MAVIVFKPIFHGLSDTPEYRAWQTMRQRCTAPTNPAWPNYGGRGITICQRWIESPVNFIADVGLKPFPKADIDRIDNNKGYTCGHCDDCKSKGAEANCRWTTRKINARNRRSGRVVEYKGEKKTLIEWIELLGLNKTAATARISNGWPAELAFETPIRHISPKGCSPPKPPRIRPPFKLDEAVKNIIRDLMAGQMKNRELAVKHGVNIKYVQRISCKERRADLWAKVEEEDKAKSTT